MNISSYDSLLVINQGSKPYVGNNGPASGMIRYNTNTQQNEVFDGSVWISMNSNADISTSSMLREVVAWAQKKMSEEREFEELVKKNETIKHAKEQLDMLVALTKDHNAKNISS